MRYNLGSLDWMDVSLCLCLVDGWTTGMFQTLHRTKYGTGERFQSHCHSLTHSLTNKQSVYITDYGLRITDYGLYKRQTYLPVTTHQGNQDIVAHFSLHSLNDGPLIPSTN